MTRPRRRPFDPAAKVHDRRASEVGRQSQVAPIVVDDPMGLDPGDKIAVMRNLRDDPLARLHFNKAIDEAQFHAGRAYEADFETAQRGPRAIDPEKEAVDGGCLPEPITEAQWAAGTRLRDAFKVLKLNGSAIVTDVVVRGLSCRSLAKRRGLGPEFEQFFEDELKILLNKLAYFYGFSKSPSSRVRICVDEARTV